MVGSRNFSRVRKVHLQPEWLSGFDALGLLVAVLSVVPRLPAADGRQFAVLLTSFSVIAWLVTVQLTRPHRYLRPRLHEMLAVPALAAAATLLASALMRSYYSGTALGIFVVLWTVWLLGSRAVLARFFPPLRVLLVGTPSLVREVRQTPQLMIKALPTPPDSFDNWDLVILESASAPSDAWLQWLAHADIAGVKVMSVAAFLETVTGRVSTEVLHGLWAPLVLHGHSRYALPKRLFDLSITLLALPLLLPLAALVALTVYLDGGRPILFWQERVGKGGVPFQMVKFRSMRQDSEVNGAAFATQGDLRITRVGAFLRKFRLDELPQFYNVLRGEMSIIGPRPEQRVFVAQFSEEIPLYNIRHHVRPGITGWAQVTQGYASGEDETREKIRCDFYYIKNFSLGLDLQIVMKTVQTVLSGFGAR
jgi:lipopolysaccharide/colanic/teichoic acid biosynthesis glycosyltransferase